MGWEEGEKRRIKERKERKWIEEKKTWQEVFEQTIQKKNNKKNENCIQPFFFWREGNRRKNGGWVFFEGEEKDIIFLGSGEK